MHFVISWDIKVNPEENDEWTEINEALKECINRHDWVKPLKNFYIVKVKSQLDVELVRSRILAQISAYPGKISYVISPLMSGGKYTGWLPKALWPEIRSKTE